MRLFSRVLTECTHVPDEPAAPRGDRCEGCGSRFNLRVCTACGYVGCCESQQHPTYPHADVANPSSDTIANTPGRCVIR